MFKVNWSKILFHVGVVILFLAVTFTYFSYVLDGKELNAHDNVSWKAMTVEAKDFQKETGEHTLWTNSMFGEIGRASCRERVSSPV